MTNSRTYSLEELLEIVSLGSEKVHYFIERQWISPAEVKNSSFDDEDISRLKFIIELQKDFEVNDEGIDLILHLVDQFYSLKRELITKLPS